MNANNMHGDQNRSFGFVDAPAPGQPMNSQVIPPGLMSPTGHQSLKGGFVSQQTAGQFHPSQHPRTPLACYGKPPDMPVIVATPSGRYLENSLQPTNCYFNNSSAPYGSPGQMNMRYNDGSFYQHQVYPQAPQQHYYKHLQMSPMLHQNASYYQEMPQQNLGYPQRIMPEQMSPPDWNSPYKIQSQMMDSFGDCNTSKMMPKQGMERFHSPGVHCFVQQGHPGMMEYKRERYMSPPHGGFDPRMYNNYGYDGQMEKYKVNNMKFPEDSFYGQQNPNLCSPQQLGNYLPGKRLEHFSQTGQHFQMGGYDVRGSYPIETNIPPLELDKMKFHNQIQYSTDPGYYKANPIEQMNQFKLPQRGAVCPNMPTPLEEGLIKKPPEAYHSPSTETCSGSSSPSYFEVDVKYSLPSSGFPVFSRPSSVPQKMNFLDSSTIKMEPLSSINFIPHSSSQNFPPSVSQVSLEKQFSYSSASCIPTVISISTSPVVIRSSASTLASSLLSQSSRCITSTVKMTPMPSKINSILDTLVVKKEFPALRRQVSLDDGLSKVPRKAKRRKDLGDSEKTGATKIPGSRYVTVPYKWRRIIENESVYYISPSRVRLESLKEICQYLLTDGTCKCGLLCPLHVEQVFIFDWMVKSRYMTVEEVYNSSNNVASLCYHKRKYKQSVSAAIIAASGGNGRAAQQSSEQGNRKPLENMPRTGDMAVKFKGIQMLQNDINRSLGQGFSDKMVRKRAYTKAREKRKSKLETSLCDSLKNLQQQSSASAMLSNLPKQSTPPTSAFTIFQGQLKDIQAKTSAIDSYDSDATKSASDIYCSSSSSEDDEEEGFTTKPSSINFKTNFIKLPGGVSNNINNSCTVNLGNTLTSSSSTVVRNRPLLLTNLGVPPPPRSSDSEKIFGNQSQDLIRKKTFQMHGSASGMDPSPIKLVEDMVSGLLTTRSSLAEVTALMMSKVEFDRCRKILPEIGNQITKEFGTLEDKPLPGFTAESSGSSIFQMDEVIHQSVTNHLKHLDDFKSNTPIIKPACMPLLHQNALPTMGTHSSLTNVPTLLGISGSQSIFSSPQPAGSKSGYVCASLNSIVSGNLVSTPGFFYKSSMEAVSRHIPANNIALTQVLNSTVADAPSLPASNVREEMFSEEEEDNSSCVVIENWLEEGYPDKSGGSADVRSSSCREMNVIAKDSEGNLTVGPAIGEEDLMKTTGTQTSTPASNVSNSTLELVDQDSRETICCLGADNTASLDDVTFASIVSSSISVTISKTSSSVSTATDGPTANQNTSNSSSCGASVASVVSEGNVGTNNTTSSVLNPPQVPQAQVVMVPAQQPFLIPHHQTFDAQLYQTSPTGYLQSLGFGFAQGQVGLLHFGQVVAPTSSASSQGLGLALGLGVNLSGGVVGANREQTTQSGLESNQHSLSTPQSNSASSSGAIQGSVQESSIPSCSTDSSVSMAPTNQDQSQTASSSLAANQLFQLVVSQGVQPAHHFLVPNYSSFAPFAGAALVPVPMVQQNSMAFCNLVAASGAPTLFTVGQSPFGFVAAAGPATMQMLAGVNVGEKRQDSTAAASGHDAPDSTVDSEEVLAIPCTSGITVDTSEGGNSLSVMSDVQNAQVISSSRSSTETCQTSTTSAHSSASCSTRLDESVKTDELSSSSDTDDDIGFEMANRGGSKASLDVMEKTITNDDDDDDDDEDYDEDDDHLRKDEHSKGNKEDKDNESHDKRKMFTKRFVANNSSKTSNFLGMTKLLKQSKNKKLKAFLNKSRLVNKSTNNLLRSGGRRILKVSGHVGSFSPALSGTSENMSEVVTGETTTPCSSSGDCMVTSTARESAYRADACQVRPVTSMKGILRKKPRKVKVESKLQKPDSPISSDDTIDDVDSTTSIPIACQGLRSFNIGDLVWGPARGFPSWPGKLVSENEVRGNQKPESGKIWVKWFGDNTYAQADPDQLKTLSEGLETHHNARKSHRRGRKMNAGLEAAIQEAMTELDRQMARQSSNSSSSSTISERPSKKSRRC